MSNTGAVTEKTQGMAQCKLSSGRPIGQVRATLNMVQEWCHMELAGEGPVKANYPTTVVISAIVLDQAKESGLVIDEVPKWSVLQVECQCTQR